MSKIITLTLTSIRVQEIRVLPLDQKVIILYDVMTDTNEVYQSGEATFWVIMPSQIPIYNEAHEIVGYEPYSSTWYVLPPEYVTQFVSLLSDASDVISATLGL